jgi:hypothetical protein
VRRWEDFAGGALAMAPVSCTGCDRLASACTRCGWEYSGRQVDAAGVPEGEPSSCVSCVVVELTGSPRTRSEALLGARGAAQSAQHDADTLETWHGTWLRAHRAFAGAVDEAMRRALVRARLEAALERLTVDPAAEDAPQPS